jgi:hypothetical protein
VLSSLALARVAPSGLKATTRTQSVWPPGQGQRHPPRHRRLAEARFAEQERRGVGDQVGPLEQEIG